MLYISPFMTSRLNVQMRELPIGDAMSLVLMPAEHAQAAVTAFLRSVITDGGPVPDPLCWTLQERTLAVCQYLMAIHADDPDFKVGDARFSDYADLNTDIPKDTASTPIELGELGGDHWSLQHLMGYMLESIERLMLAGAIKVPTGCARLHWQFAAMGAQLVRQGEEVPDWSNPGQYDDWLAMRTTKLLSYAETDMAHLWVMYRQGQEQLRHFFDYDFTAAHESNAMVGGPVFLPQPRQEQEAAAVMQPATFPPISCVSALAWGLLGKVQKVGV